ncbi:MAG: SusE domain-containing protein, partial [Bacteroidota bacterium]
MKKHIFNLFLISALALIAFACEDDPLEDNIGIGERVEQATLASPANNITLSLNAGTPDATVVVSWEAAAAGKSGTPLYRFLLDVEGGNFSSPLASIDADNGGAATQATLTQAAINSAIANAGTTEFIWTVESRIEGGAQTDIKLANAFAINIEPFGTEGISAFTYTSPSINEQLLLDKIRTPNDPVVFDWDAATSVSGAAVTYKVQFDNPGGDFTSPILEFEADNSGLDDQLSFTQSSFSDALDGINLDNGLDWRVVATAGAFNFIPETRFVWFDSFNIETLYVLGDATSAGWNNDGVSPIQLDMKSPGVFETTIPLEGDKEIKFILVSGSWDVNWGGPDLAGSPITGGQEY